MTSMPTSSFHCDLLVLGGGAGGFGAALAAARRGLRVVLVEPHAMLGGTSTVGGVNTWEPGVAGPGLPAELYRRLARVPVQIGVSRTVKPWTPDEPWGLSRVDRTCPYETSLRRTGLSDEAWRRVTFEPAAMAGAMAEMLLETGRVDLRLGRRFRAADTAGEAIREVCIEGAGREERVRPRLVVDATGELAVCAAVGCRTHLGAEAQSVYREPDAPAAEEAVLNGVSLCWRVTPAGSPAVEPLPAGLEADERTVSHAITEYPCGDLNLNPLPLLEGMEYRRLGAEAGGRRCRQRMAQVWHWLQTRHGFDRWRLAWVAPMVGVREGPRLVGRHVLTEQEVLAGCTAQALADRWIALADHALDTHGRGHRCRMLAGPYGVPYDCLLPREYANLAVACRGASFSHIAASSCRLTRTMMGLGHAAGLAAAAAVAQGAQFPDVDLGTVRRWLAEEDVALEPDHPAFRETPSSTASA
jgi:hypothetical protein